jgi:transglutaminase-like putative cysteine protease
MSKMYERLRSSRTGFSGRLELEDRSNLLEDSRVVLRVRGEQVPRLLRGAVFTRYSAGRWLASESSSVRMLGEAFEEPTAPVAGKERIELEHARRPERYFLPADANAINPSSGYYFRDEFGIVYPPEESFAKRLWFQSGNLDALSKPQPEDSAVPEYLEQELAAVLSDWGVSQGGVGQGNAAKRLDQLHQQLQSYRHTLDSDRVTKKDPVIDFLRHNPEGHCEYFASAMVLLARSSGAPARLISGYRVAETSPFGYHIVRRLHAHAWAEVWLDGKWVIFDPTPPGELLLVNPAQTPLFSALVDGARTAWAAADDWLERRTTFEIALALLALGGLLAALRTLRQARKGATTKAISDQPLAGFLALDARLAKKGIARRPAETLSAFTTRVESTSKLSEAQRREIAAALRSYALLRYAGRGDRELLDRSLQALSRAAR